MNWTTERPTTIGWYWMCNPSYIADTPRVIHVWTYENSPGPLFTDEDGGTSIEDERYSGLYWLGPIDEPPKPQL